MQMRALLYAGLGIMAIGIIGVAIVQTGAGEPTLGSFPLGQGRHAEMRAHLEAPDTAFLGVKLDSPLTAARITVISPTGDELFDDVVSTMSSVDYFMVTRSGEHTVRATLASAVPSTVSLEVGQTSSAQTMYPAATLVIGVIAVIAWSCVAIVRYITAQPDENTL